AAAFQDPLDTPAVPSALAPQSVLIAAARVNQRLIAAGSRGHILVSDDGGRVWNQRAVPVSSDLTALHFPAGTQASRGWAVGHDGVVLHSPDGGLSWVKQLDGRQANALMVDHYEKLAQAGDADASRVLSEVKRLVEPGPDQPFLDVWFENEQTGYVVGSFNMIFRTSDGGRSWEPLYHRTENPEGLHLYGVRGIGGEIYIAGERGLLLKLNRATDRFSALSSPYKGTYFGIVGKLGTLVVYGLRGNAFRSQDAGKTWQKSETGISSGITAGTLLPDGRFVLVSQGGQVLLSADDGRTFTQIRVAQPAPLYGVAAVDARGIATVGARGVRIDALDAKQ
ncbi:MAG TPA: YCF48-related protein, partial [Burkholderiaceae bacterium]|nr:YCF48-related protein [Burkholderiaceae bacterium]